MKALSDMRRYHTIEILWICWMGHRSTSYISSRPVFFDFFRNEDFDWNFWHNSKSTLRILRLQRLECPCSSEIEQFHDRTARKDDNSSRQWSSSVKNRMAGGKLCSGLKKKHFELIKMMKYRKKNIRKMIVFLITDQFLDWFWWLVHLDWGKSLEYPWLSVGDRPGSPCRNRLVPNLQEEELGFTFVKIKAPFLILLSHKECANSVNDRLGSKLRKKSIRLCWYRKSDSRFFWPYNLSRRKWRTRSLSLLYIENIYKEKLA